MNSNKSKEAETSWWRLDPSESHSDYQIEIMSLDEEATDCAVHATYRVHRVILSLGLHKSVYFERLFQSQYGESQRRMSRISLAKIAAEAFPEFLDYVYGVDVAITTKNAVPLDHLAEYFEVDPLRKVTNVFLTSGGMKASAFGTYYQQAKVFRNEKIILIIVQKTLEQPMDMDNTDLFEKTDEEFWFKVLKENNGNPSSSRRLSFAIAGFCSEHKDEPSRDTFLKLTGPVDMPEIHESVSLSLLILEKEICAHSSTSDQLTCLQERCVNALAKNPHQLKTEETLTQLVKLSPFVLAQLVSRSAGLNCIAAGLLRIATEDSLRLPHSIRVQGAGSESVNGTYTRRPGDNNMPIYEMQGKWDNQIGQLELRFSDSLDSTFYWSIIFRSGSSTLLYFSDESEERHDSIIFLPPKSGWVTGPEGSGPAPTLTYNYR